jgi:hypothetical protein
MLYNDSLLYLELQKTGCTHVRKVLLSNTENKLIEYGKHNGYNQLPNNIKSRFESYTKIGNIRNPWDWYVSLWAYGCQGGGGFKARLKRDSNDWKAWQKTYVNANNIENFNTWLDHVLVSKRKDIKEYRGLAKTSFCGILTCRYLTLYTKDFKTRCSEFQSLQDLEAHDSAENYLDITLRNEFLDSDLEAFIAKFNLKSNFPKKSKTNTSNRKSYKYYYSEKSKELIEDMESLIIRKHNYTY